MGWLITGGIAAHTEVAMFWQSVLGSLHSSQGFVSQGCSGDVATAQALSEESSLWQGGQADVSSC